MAIDNKVSVQLFKMSVRGTGLSSMVADTAKRRNSASRWKGNGTQTGARQLENKRPPPQLLRKRKLIMKHYPLFLVSSFSTTGYNTNIAYSQTNRRWYGKYRSSSKGSREREHTSQLRKSCPLLSSTTTIIVQQ
jgi:hypothetical protein